MPEKMFVYLEVVEGLGQRRERPSYQGLNRLLSIEQTGDMGGGREK